MTSGSATATGSGTEPVRSRAASADTITTAARSRSSRRPVRAGLTTGSSPSSVIAASAAFRSIAFASRRTRLLDRRRVGHPGRLDVRPADAQAEPLEAPEQDEAVAPLERLLDGSVPVRGHAKLGGRQEEALLAAREHDRLRRESGGPALERARRLLDGHAADVDARDGHAGRDPVG